MNSSLLVKGPHETGIGELDLAVDFRDLKLSAIDAVFFDLGETLVVLSPSKEELFIRAASSVGLQIGIESARQAYQIVDFHNTYSSIYVTDRNDFYHRYNRQLCEVLGISNSFAELQPVLAAHFEKGKNWALVEDAVEVLRSLHQRRLPLALVANWDTNLSPLAEELGISQFFSIIVSSQAAGVEKPDPAIFRLALERLPRPVLTERVLYVGNDYRSDVLGARAAGLTPVLIDRSGGYPHADCARFTSLLKFLESLK